LANLEAGNLELPNSDPTVRQTESVELWAEPSTDPIGEILDLKRELEAKKVIRKL
jgi:hypothetical protein